MQITINGYDPLYVLEAAQAALSHVIQHRPKDDGYGDFIAEVPMVSSGVSEEAATAKQTDWVEATPPPPAEAAPAEATPPPQEAPAPAPAPAPAGDLDSAGVPWDERIHSSGETKMKNGQWTKKRGVDQAEYERVVAELKGAAPAEHTPPAPAPALASDSTPPPPPQVQAQATSELKWEEVVDRVLKAKSAGTVNQDQLERQATGLGVAGGFAELVLHPEQWTRFVLGLGI